MNFKINYFLIKYKFFLGINVNYRFYLKKEAQIVAIFFGALFLALTNKPFEN